MAVHIATDAQRDHLEWRCGVLNDSPRFNAFVENLREDARRPRRVGLDRGTGFADYPLEVLRACAASMLEEPRASRAYAWSATRVARDTYDPAPNTGGDHLRRYDSKLAAAAGYFLGATAAATTMHELVQAPSGSCVRPAASIGAAPVGAGASSAAAALSGAEHKAPSTRRDALARVTPGSRGGFVYVISPPSSR